MMTDYPHCFDFISQMHAAVCSMMRQQKLHRAHSLQLFTCIMETCARDAAVRVDRATACQSVKPKVTPSEYQSALLDYGSPWK
jgi:hypothetical protein